MGTNVTQWQIQSAVVVSETFRRHIAKGQESHRHNRTSTTITETGLTWCKRDSTSGPRYSVTQWRVSNVSIVSMSADTSRSSAIVEMLRWTALMLQTPATHSMPERPRLEMHGCRLSHDALPGRWAQLAMMTIIDADATEHLPLAVNRRRGRLDHSQKSAQLELNPVGCSQPVENQGEQRILLLARARWLSATRYS